MSRIHTLEKGENLIAISEAEGFWAQTIWDHPNNKELRERRQFLNILAPGDEIFIPDKEPKELARSTGRRHRFRRKGIPAIFRLRLLVKDEPYANKKYILRVDGVDYAGVTDSEGRLHQHLPASASTGELIVEGSVTLALTFSTLSPVGEIEGIQNRLRNLGFYDGPVDGRVNDATSMAIRRLQAHFDREETGKLDDGVRELLQQLHDKSSEEMQRSPDHG